jgi:RHS repeat-associated protein
MPVPFAQHSCSSLRRSTRRYAARPLSGKTPYTPAFRGHKSENRLTAVETSTNLVGAARRRSEFVYDHQWRRVRRRDLTDWSAGGYHATNSTRFVYDGWNIVAELSHTDTPTLHYSHTNLFTWGQDLSGTRQGAGGIGGLLCRVSSSGAHPVLLYCYDGNGNVVNLADGNGAVVAGYTYDPFGRTVAMHGPAAPANAYRFSTKPVDDVFGLYYYGYRYYSPGLGRWLSRDPIEEPDPIREQSELQRRNGHLLSVSPPFGLHDVPDTWLELNLFGFVENDPVNGFDVLGLKSDFAKTCPSGWIWAPRDDAIAEIPPADGCSFVPDDYDGCFFTPSCNNHDYCYSDCDMSRKDCDKNLKSDMETACEACASNRTFPNDKSKNEWLKKCKRRAAAYYWGVRAGGSSPYSDRQKKACGCTCDISQFLP